MSYFIAQPVHNPVRCSVFGSGSSGTGQRHSKVRNKLDEHKKDILCHQNPKRGTSQGEWEAFPFCSFCPTHCVITNSPFQRQNRRKWNERSHTHAKVKNSAVCVCSRSFDSTASGAAARKQSHRFMLFYCHFPFASFHLFILAECQQISLPVEERSAVAAFHLIFFLLWQTRMGKKMAIVTTTHKHTRAHHVKRIELRAGARCLVGRTERGEIAGLFYLSCPVCPLLGRIPQRIAAGAGASQSGRLLHG